MVDGSHVDLGKEVASAMTGSPELYTAPDAQARNARPGRSQMSLGKSTQRSWSHPGSPPRFSLPPNLQPRSKRPAPGPEIELLTNPRLGGVGVSLASGALGAAVPEISSHLADQVSPTTTCRPHRPKRHARSSRLRYLDPGELSPAARQRRPRPERVLYRPADDHVRLPGRTIVNTSVDVALGYSATEIGPRMETAPSGGHQPRPDPPHQVGGSRRGGAGAAALLLLAGVTVMNAYAPHVLLLWLYVSFAAAVVAEGTIFFMAWLGSLGQVVAMLVFIYLSLASSGGTIPVQAVPAFYRFVSNFEPLRQVLGGVRSIIYFNAQGAAGLDHAWLMTGIGFVIWLVLGLAVTRSYDKRGLDRIESGLLAYINRVTDEYIDAKPAGSAPAEQGRASGAPK